MRITAKKTLHDAMRQLHRKYGRARKMKPGDWYEAAFGEFIEYKKVESVWREKLHGTARGTRQLKIRSRQLSDQLTLLRMMSQNAIVDEALTRFLAKPENTL